MPKIFTNVKDDILATTQMLLKETGYAELSIRKVALQCGVATGTVYNYYNSKTEIIAEILYREWELMLKRIGEKAKEPLAMLTKLEIMFNELNNFMLNVHGAWFQSYPVSGESKIDVSMIRAKRQFLRSQLSERIMLFMAAKSNEDIEAINICNVIANILISHSNDNVDFSKLKVSLNALINELRSISPS